MNLPRALPHHDEAAHDALRAALGAGDRVLARVGPILGHLLSTPDQSLFSEEVVARVRGMLADLAWQMLRAQAEAAGQTGRAAFAERHGEALADHFQNIPDLLSHCHALAIEWQLAARLEAQGGLDPVLPPLVQDLLASDDAATSSAAMAALAAQARFAQTQRRMELPLAELPADLFHEVLLAWRGWNGPASSDALIRAESRLRDQYDESAGRLALLSRLAAGFAADDMRPFAIESAGVGLFASALAARGGQPRELALLATNPRQSARLALTLRAAGCGQDVIDSTLFRLHPDHIPPAGLALIAPGEAREMLAQGMTGGGR